MPSTSLRSGMQIAENVRKAFEGTRLMVEVRPSP
jgi:hypothetical protein